MSSSENNSPPPLPNRIGSGKNSAFQRVHSGQGSESPLFANSSSTNSSPAIYQHPPPPRMKVSGDPAARFNGYDPANGKTTRTFNNSPKVVTTSSINHFTHEEKRSGDARDERYRTFFALNCGQSNKHFFDRKLRL